ncbi:DNA mismatch repair protein MutT [Thermobispora bispora]
MKMRKVVVGAAIVQDGRLLAAQRSAPPELRGAWELPGGKVGPGETDQQALARECEEELGIEIALGRQVGADWPLPNGYVMRVWLAGITLGIPRPHEHLALRWLARDELYDVEWLPADRPVIAAVEELLWS